MGILTNQANRDIVADSQSSDAPSTYTVNLGGIDYRVIDGDTIQEVGENKPRLRIRRRKAAETLHYAGSDAEGNPLPVSQEIGGDYERDVLFSVLSEGKFGNVLNQGKQQYGGGAGERELIDIKNTDTGQDLNEYLLGAGLVDTNNLSTQMEVDAVNAGELRRKMGGEDKYAALRSKKAFNTQGFKQTALDSQWYVNQGGDDLYSGIAFRKVNETDEGFTTTPLATAFSTGYFGLLSDLGGALNAVGVLTGNEWAQEQGSYASFINNERQANNPFQKISRLSDIGAENDGFINATADAFQWLGVNAVQSAPFLIALVGSSVLSGGVAGVAGASAATAGVVSAVAGTGTSAAFHAGEIWNNLDVDKRTGANAGKALAMGTFAGALDRLALGALAGINKTFSPSSLLSKEGRERVAEFISKKQGVGLPEARAILNKSVKKETDVFLKDAYQTTKGLISKQRVVQDIILKAIPAIGSEALTESLQELTTYITAQAINEGVAGIDDTFDFIVEELAGDNPELREILLNAGVAGGAIGGGFSAVSGIRQVANTSKYLANLDTSSSAELAPIAKIYYENANTDNSIEAEQNKINIELDAGVGKDTAFDGGTVKGTNERYRELGEKRSGISRVISGESTFLGELANQTKKLYKEELLRILPVQALSDSRALRSLYSAVSGVRNTHAGQSFEKYIATSLGTLKHITNARKIGKLHNFNYKSERQLAAFSDKLYKFGEFTQDRDPNSLSDADLKSIGISRSEIGKYADSAARFEVRANLQLQSRQDELSKVYSANDSRTVEGSRKVKGWWWKHRTIDSAKVISNPKAFKRIVEDAVRRLDKKHMNKDEKARYQNPTLFAEKLTEAIITGVPLDTAFGPDFSLVNAGAKLPGERTLNLSEQAGIKDFLDNNIFRTQHTADDASIRNIARLKYFGPQGSKMDVMLDNAGKELRDAGYAEHEITDMLSQTAVAVDGIINASESNYNTIKNPTLRKLQSYALMYTGFIGMGLSAPASIPEYAAVLIGVRKHAGLHKYAQSVGNEFFKGIGRTLHNAKAKATGSARIEDEFYDLLEQIGVPNDSGYFQRKFGTGDELSVGPALQRVNRGYYWAIGLQGVTEMQRTLAASTAIDMVRNESEILLNAKDRLVSQDLNSDEIQAYSKLQELGIDVVPFINKLDKSLGANVIEKSFKNVNADLLPDLQRAILSFVDSRIQNPGAANRPLLLQDPHYRMLTQFNGFISAVTTTLVPKIWNDNVGRGIRTGNPSLTFDTFAVVITLILLGGVGQWLKDLAKFGEDTPYLEGYDKYFQRALNSSGVLGQSEKLLELAHPLYEKEGLGKRALDTVTGSAGRTSGSVTDVFVPRTYGDVTEKEETLNDILKLIPGLSNLTGFRAAVVDKLT